MPILSVIRSRLQLNLFSVSPIYACLMGSIFSASSALWPVQGVLFIKSPAVKRVTYKSRFYSPSNHEL